MTEEERTKAMEVMDAGVRDFTSPKTLGWVRLSGNYLAKKDGSGMNLHFRTDHPAGEGHFFIPEDHFWVLAKLFDRLERASERKKVSLSSEPNKAENLGKIKAA